MSILKRSFLVATLAISGSFLAAIGAVYSPWNVSADIPTDQAQIAITNNVFTPASITVTAGPTVYWTNNEPMTTRSLISDAG